MSIRGTRTTERWPGAAKEIIRPEVATVLEEIFAMHDARSHWLRRKENS